MRARFATNGGEAHSDRARLSLLGKDIGQTEIVHWLGAFEGSVGSAAFGMDHPLGDSLSVEVGDEIDQMEVLEQERPVDTDSLGFIRVGVWYAIAGGVQRLLRGSIAVILVGSVEPCLAVTVGLALSSRLGRHDGVVGRGF